MRYELPGASLHRHELNSQGAHPVSPDGRAPCRRRTRYATTITQSEAMGVTRNQNAGLDTSATNATTAYTPTDAAQTTRLIRCNRACFPRAQLRLALTSNASTANGANTHSTNSVTSRLDEFLRPATSTQMTAHDAAASIANLVAMGVRGASGVLMALPLS